MHTPERNASPLAVLHMQSTIGGTIGFHGSACSVGGTGAACEIEWRKHTAIVHVRAAVPHSSHWIYWTARPTHLISLQLPTPNQQQPQHWIPGTFSALIDGILALPYLFFGGGGRDPGQHRKGQGGAPAAVLVLHAWNGPRGHVHKQPPPPPPTSHFLSVYFFSVSFCPCLPGPLGLDKLSPTPPPCPLTA